MNTLVCSQACTAVEEGGLQGLPRTVLEALEHIEGSTSEFPVSEVASLGVGVLLPGLESLLAFVSRANPNLAPSRIWVTSQGSGPWCQPTSIACQVLL